MFNPNMVNKVVLMVDAARLDTFVRVLQLLRDTVLSADQSNPHPDLRDMLSAQEFGDFMHWLEFMSNVPEGLAER